MSDENDEVTALRKLLRAAIADAAVMRTALTLIKKVSDEMPRDPSSVEINLACRTSLTVGAGRGWVPPEDHHQMTQQWQRIQDVCVELVKERDAALVVLEGDNGQSLLAAATEAMRLYHEKLDEQDVVSANALAAGMRRARADRIIEDGKRIIDHVLEEPHNPARVAKLFPVLRAFEQYQKETST